MTMELALAIVRMGIYSTAFAYGLYRRNALVAVCGFGNAATAILVGLEELRTLSIALMPLSAALAFAMIRLADAESALRRVRGDGTPP